MEQEGHDGLGVREHHGAPHNDVGKVLDLAEEAPQAGTRPDDLMVNQGVPVLVHVRGSSVTAMVNRRHLPGVAKDTVQVKNDERFRGETRRRRRQAARNLPRTLWWTYLARV